MKYKDELPDVQGLIKSHYITDDNAWKVYGLYILGYKLEKNCHVCPETVKLIEGIPGMITAGFSVLMPRKHIPKHRDLFNKSVVRGLLELIIPTSKTGCRMQVENATLYWEEGKVLMVPRNLEHEVRNDTDKVRGVLLIDVVQPLSFPVSILNNLMIRLLNRTSRIQRARKNHERWQEHFDEVVRHSKGS